MDAGLVGWAGAKRASAHLWLRQGALLLAALLGMGRAQELIYTEVRAPQPVVAVGAALELEVVLLDAYAAPVAAPETYTVSVEVYRDADAGELLEAYSVPLEAGEVSAPLTIRVSEPGTFRVVAAHPVLVSRDLFVQVYDPAGSAVPPALHGWPGLARAATPPPAAPASYKLIILPPRLERSSVLANGDDRARLQFFLSDGAGQPVRAPEDIELTLATDGTLSPERVVIAKGQTSTTAFLRSAAAGLVDVTYLGAIPAVSLHEATPQPVQVRFESNKLKLEAVETTPLVAPVTLTIKLLDVNGNPLPARADREVKVTMAAASRGRGVFKPVARTVIEKGSFQEDVTFIPTWPGRVELLASSARLASAPSTVTVSLAPLWFVIVLAGGIVGSFVHLVGGAPGANAVRAPAARQVLARLFIGLVAGALLYWAYLFGILLPPLPATANALLLHSFTAFFVPLLGAFAGVRVLNRLLDIMMPPKGGQGDGAT